MKKTLLTILALILTVILGTQVANAIGSLNPSRITSDDIQYSLNDIYDKLSNFSASPTATLSPFTTPGSVSASFHTLSEIYGLLTSENTDLVAENIKSGTTIFGVTGTMRAASAPLIWQTDPGLGLCFDGTRPQLDNSCSEGSGLFNGGGAVQYCVNLTAEGSSNWRLPTISEYSSITDLTTYNNATQVPGFDNSNVYWSSTEFAEHRGYSWYWHSGSGDINYVGKHAQYRVRCVR